MIASGAPFGQDVAAVDDVGAIDQPQRLAHVVIGDQDADAPSLQVPHKVLNVADGDRVDAGEGLVEQHEGRLSGERARDFAAPPLAARQGDRRRAAQARDVELLQEQFQHRFARRPVGLVDLQHRADVVLDIEAAEDRRFLRQVADAEPRPLEHGQAGDVVAVQLDRALVRFDEADDHVEDGRLAGAVRPQEADRFAAPDRNADVLHHHSAAIAFAEAVHSEHALPVGLRRIR